MIQLPIRHMTLYKHGVGFYERRAQFTGESVELSFRVEEMNDILKSLTAIDWGTGKVLGIDYATPQSKEERLEGCSIHLSDERSLQDLVVALRGREVRLHLDQGEQVSGVVVGLDEAPAEQPLGTTLVSILADEANNVSTYPISRLQGLDVLDAQGANDLRFFLRTSLSQEQYRQVSIRLTPGEHELSISYIAPAPTWRVSYRLVMDTLGKEKKSLLFGWGIFDNRLEEDLQGISLSLVAGMPISFVYDLYNPFTPARPVIKEEGRVASGPVEFEATLRGASKPAQFKRDEVTEDFLSVSPGRHLQTRVAARAIQESTPVDVTSKDLGELFQYILQTPVTVGRGQSAMVPILTSPLEFHKDLLYNNMKMPRHPVATLRMENSTGLALERGPVTVLENGEYVGEAVMPFTPMGKEIVVPYAVELGVRIAETPAMRDEIHALRIQAGYLVVENWSILTIAYQINNTTSQPQTILIEHPRRAEFDLFDSPKAKETTPEFYRFEVQAPAQGEFTQEIKERRLTYRREEIRSQSLENLSRFLRQGLLEQKVFDKLADLLHLWEKLAEHERELAQIDKDREKIFKVQQQIQGNMGALGNTGREGDLRIRYVSELETTEEKLRQMSEKEAYYRSQMEQIEAEIQARLKALK